MEELLAVGVVLDEADLQAGDGADGVDGAVDGDLLPDEGQDVLTEHGLAAALVEAVLHILAGGLGELVVLQRAEVHDDALAGGGDAAARAVERGADDAGADHAAGSGVVLEQLGRRCRDR